MLTSTCCALAATVITADAVLFYSTDDPNHNTSPPTGRLADSGWQLQGFWGEFLGTPIAPNYFITASHLGGGIGNEFIFREVSYATVAFFDDPNSDLRIWKICGVFPAFAPMYSMADEAEKALVVFGRGTQRGGPVAVTAILGSELKGWLWGPSDHVPRWGENRVAAIVDGDGLLSMAGSASGEIGSLLKATFDAGGGPNEAHLSAGDSGGAVFIQDGSIWKLAGINYSVDGPYSMGMNESGFVAAIFDEGGLYKGNEGGRVLTPDLPVDVPGAFYSTRISSNLTWINSVIAGAATSPVVQSAPEVSGPYADDPSAVVDHSSNSLTLALRGNRRFYRLLDCQPRRITGTRVSGENLVLNYD